jgi:hypothetical protein
LSAALASSAEAGSENAAVRRAAALTIPNDFNMRMTTLHGRGFLDEGFGQTSIER